MNGSEVALPEEYLTIAARYVGIAMQSSFGIGDLATATQAQDVIERQLLRLAAIPPTGDVIEGVYF